MNIESINSLYKKLYLNFVVGEELTNDETILLNKLLTSNEFYSKVYCVLFRNLLSRDSATIEYIQIKERFNSIVDNYEEHNNLDSKFSNIKANIIKNDVKTNNIILNKQTINIINQSFGYRDNLGPQFDYLKVKFNSAYDFNYKYYLFLKNKTNDKIYILLINDELNIVREHNSYYGLVNLEPLFHENQLTHFLKRLNE